MDSALTFSAANLGAKSRAIIETAAAHGTDAAKSAAREAAQEFEAVFLTTMLEGMFSGLETDAPFGGGPSEKTYRSLMVGEYAKQIAGNGGLGIADDVYRELLATQESANQ